jgi:transcriptional regulator with XRE-family HTH domain
MNVIRILRRQIGFTQQQLASKAGTAQSTIAAYESGRKSPTMRTLQKTAHAVGLEVHVVFVTPLTRTDRRSLAYHHAIVRALVNNPQPILSRARNQLNRLIEDHPHASSLNSRWQNWLDLPVADLASRMLDVGEEARDMRQVSPFAGVLSASERTEVLRLFRQECREEVCSPVLYPAGKRE